LTNNFRLCLLVVLPVALATFPQPAHAGGEVRVGADASANVGYSTNPFSQIGESTGSALAEFQLYPKLSWVSERSIFTLSGAGQFQHYARLYGDSTNYGMGLDYSGTPNEHVRSHLYLKYDWSIIGGNDLVTGVIDPSLPIIPVLSGTDISLFGTRDRRRTLHGGGDVSVALSPRDQFTASAYYLSSRYDRFGSLGNNDDYGGSLGFSRRVTERLELGGRTSVARYDYQGALGSTTVISPQLSFAATLGPRWKADGAIGVSFLQAASSGSARSVSGDLRLCRTSSRGNFCLVAQRAVVPTGLSGTQNFTSADASYSYKLSERGTVSATVGYMSNANRQLLLASQNRYLRGSISYEHVLRERLRLVVSSQYRRIFGGLVRRSADYGGRIGFALRLGDLR
jgi:hypothetical protein